MQVTDNNRFHFSPNYRNYIRVENKDEFKFLNLSIGYFKKNLNRTGWQTCEQFFPERNSAVEVGFKDVLDSRLPDCAAIVKTPHIRVFVIPGLTRNPVLFRYFTLLDAGSSQA